MSERLKEGIVSAVIIGLFTVIAALITRQGGGAAPVQQQGVVYGQTSPVVVTGGNSVAVSSGWGNASSVSNISVVDSRVSATNGGIAIGGINQGGGKNAHVVINGKE